jgi:hypothetical protein
VERRERMLERVLTDSSITSLTRDSMVSGSAPRRTVEIEMIGKSTLGNRSMPRFISETAPKTIIDRMTIAVNSGRRMAIVEMNIRESSNSEFRSPNQARSSNDE